MATQQPRLQPDLIASDRAIVQAVATLIDYAPVNVEYSVATLQQLEATLVAAQQNEDRILREAAIARREVIAAAEALHAAVKGMKIQVEAQYGSDSPALHAVGRKRNSEYKRPARRRPAE